MEEERKIVITAPRQLIHKTLIVLDEFKIYRDERFRNLIGVYELIGTHPLYGKNIYWFFTFCDRWPDDFDEYKFVIENSRSNRWIKKCTSLSITKLQLPHEFYRFFRGNGLDRERAIKDFD